MEILKEKGRPVTIFGYEYALKISLNSLAKMEDELGDLAELRLNYKTVPAVMEILIGEYCDDHPDVPRITKEMMMKEFTPYEVSFFTKLIVTLLNTSYEGEIPNA